VSSARSQQKEEKVIPKYQEKRERKEKNGTTGKKQSKRSQNFIFSYQS